MEFKAYFKERPIKVCYRDYRVLETSFNLNENRYISPEVLAKGAVL